MVNLPRAVAYTSIASPVARFGGFWDWGSSVSRDSHPCHYPHLRYHNGRILHGHLWSFFAAGDNRPVVYGGLRRTRSHAQPQPQPPPEAAAGAGEGNVIGGCFRLADPC